MVTRSLEDSSEICLSGAFSNNEQLPQRQRQCTSVELCRFVLSALFTSILLSETCELLDAGSLNGDLKHIVSSAVKQSPYLRPTSDRFVAGKRSKR